MKASPLKRYAEVRDKYPREVVLLRSVGCSWGRCPFCDYRHDADRNAARCVGFNREILKSVRGSCNGTLQIIDSASFNELPAGTLFDIVETCARAQIRTLVLEQHWSYRDTLRSVRDTFAAFGVACKFIVGLESFDYGFRETVLKKGMGRVLPEEAGRYFQWANLLCGLEGQTLGMIEADIAEGLRRFERIIVNVFVPNSTPFRRDEALVEAFYRSPLFARLRDSPSAEILDIRSPLAPDTLGGIGYPEAAPVQNRESLCPAGNGI
ncbi:hypothetical protein [Treponema endosymbiont of Eucomonympha sp.]|uniref:hypothetical protein n=1 Tax=Treponema endosymbiont of Eucomonympha sp. TaxID=1580831 RepID=UPI000750E44C|nr:hypothetical protein [Treponema endosymbiont of Eucomonympha sp.]